MAATTEADVVSVLMLTVNRPQFVKPAVESLVMQDHLNWELLIIHDGIDARVTEAVEPWLARDSRIRYFHRRIMGGMANAWNFGLTHARGPFIGILDDDDAWLRPDKLRRQVECLVARSDVACVGGGAIVVDGKGREVMRYLKPAESSECRKNALLANPIVHSTAVFRKAAVEAVGGYDEGLRGYMDWDLWLKVMRHGNVMNLPDYLATYRIWDGGGSSRNVMGNAVSAFWIVSRHRRFFKRFPLAIVATLCYIAFALLPSALRRQSYQTLSQLKKRAFASRSPAS